MLCSPLSTRFCSRFPACRQVDVVPKALLRYHLTASLPTSAQEHGVAGRSRMRALRPYLEQVPEDQRRLLLNETVAETGLPLEGGRLSGDAHSIFPRLKTADGAQIITYW